MERQGLYSQPEEPQLPCGVQTFQDGRCLLYQGPTEQERVYGPQRCLSDYASSSHSPGVSAISVAAEGVPVHRTSLRISISTQSVQKLLKSVLASLRSKGVRLIAYLDDILIIGKTRLKVERAFQETKQFLESLGFVVNEEKSQPKATQKWSFWIFS